jgi:anti-sigma28 factor (negative regulator of flagellin synthesis)
VPRTLDLPPDGSQVSELGGAIAAALRSDDQKVECLRREVAVGEYVVDPVKIAEKMLRADNSE